MNYKEYLSENLDKHGYAEYLAEHLDKSIKYSEYNSRRKKKENRKNFQR